MADNSSAETVSKFGVGLGLGVALYFLIRNLSFGGGRGQGEGRDEGAPQAIGLREHLPQRGLCREEI